MEEHIRKAYRLPPCPAYDVEGVESWLSDLAREGLFLERDGIFAGVMSFERRAPQTVRYRLEAVQHRPGFLEGPPGDPEEDLIALYAGYGWEYLLKYGDFYIYRAVRSDCRELDTDPQVQAMALNVVRRKERSAAISSLVYLLVFLLCGFRQQLMLSMIGMGTGYILLILALVLWGVISQFLSFLHLHRLCKKLRRDGGLDHRKNWRTNARLSYAGRLIYPCLVLILVCLTFRQCSTIDNGEIPLADFSGRLPFVTIADLASGTYTPLDTDYSNTVRQWSDPLAPVNYDFRQSGTLITGSGAISGSLTITYHETAAPWIARAVAGEYVRDEDDSKYYRILDLPQLDADYAAAYDHYGFTVVLQKGNVVVHAVCYVNGPDGENLYAQWAEQMAQLLN